MMSLVWSSLPSVSAHASSSSVPASSLGYDISFPQCNNPNLPVSPGFGIVGVNDGHPFSTNPCLVSEVRWSQASLTGQANFYENTDDPGPTNNASWPRAQQLPQLCHGANSAPCAYDYGWNAAHASFANAIAAEAAAGSSAPSSAATTARWWLDVESGNAWEALSSTYGRSALTLGNDQGVIQGALAYFASVGVSSVGIYSTGYQWNEIMGKTGSTFASTQAWMPGYATLGEAEAACLSPSFLGGRVAMIQYPSIGLDGDYACGLISSPTTASVTVAGSSTYLAQLSVVGESSPLTYTQSTGAPSLLVSSTGSLSVPTTLAPGDYVASGTVKDALGNSGTFSFLLVVGVITQTSPTSSSVTVAGSSTFSSPMVVSGSDGTTVFSTTTSSPSLLVSPAGLVTTTHQLAPGTYTVSGTTSDQSGDHGNFTYSLVVGALAQNGPLIASVTANQAPTFTQQLAVTGANGPVTFTQTSGSPNLVVSSSGLVTTSGPLTPGSYVARGTTSDTSGDQGKFFFNLRVSAAVFTPIVQNEPLSASVASISSATFTQQLSVSGASGAVTFTQTSGAPTLLVSSSGLVTTSAVLAPGSYVVSGTTSDASGDTGVFTFALNVGSLTQSGPLFASILAAAAPSFTQQLSVSGANGAVTFTQTSGAPALLVSSTGLLSTSGTLASGSYVARGTTSDASGDTGKFFFNLRVGAVVATPIVQNEPLATSVASAASSTFTQQLDVTDVNGAVTFTQTSGAPALLVS
ncbi:MAG TPA: hypothetical protein PLG60_08145, partial [Acidimicrobiales bacterium]|nr:hypothetical protein [Acidimicrobiales bacterium]